MFVEQLLALPESANKVQLGVLVVVCWVRGAKRYDHASNGHVNCLMLG